MTSRGETSAGLSGGVGAGEDVEVVITGMAGKFPGSANVEELRDNLFNKVNLVTEDNCKWKANNKWNVPSATGNIIGALKFDHAQFGIHHKQVMSLDPMTRLIMERSFEAICDSGMSLADLKGSNTGVYMSSTHGEGEMMFDYEVHGDGFGVLGQNRSMLSTRVSYFLDVSGPSFVAETSWCGGISMLTQAFRDIKAGRCDAAIVGAPSLTLFPAMSWHMMQVGVLSADAKCKAFDEAADGYGRSEAIVVLFLQKSSNAKRIYASIVHSEANCYGTRPSYNHTSELSISKLLSDFYRQSGVDPAELVYLEADGTGIKNDDEAELNAIDNVLLHNRTTPLLIGSVKSNLGHTEAASSLVSIVKVLLAMETGFIPPNLHYTNPALGIPALTEGRLQVVTEKTVWPGGLAAVNSFGMDGYYGHILLKSFDHKKNKTFDGMPRLVMISGRSDVGVQQILSKMESIPFNSEYIRLIQDVHINNIAGHLYRGFAIATPKKNKVVRVERYSGRKRPVWFVFSGMGSQWAGMGQHLLQVPIFRDAIDKCHAILRPLGLDLMRIITDNDATIFDKILHCFVGIASVQIGLLDIMSALDIVPDGMIGHSVGELGCAYADGCITAKEMILAAYARGQASQETVLIQGTMAAVGLGFSQIESMLPPTIEVACHNGPGSCTISGPSKELEEFVVELTSKGIFAKSVNVANIAYHSRYIAPAAPRLLELLKEIIPTPKPRSSRWISTSIPEDKWDGQLAQTSSPEYHTNNLLSSVLFEEGSRHIPKDAVTIEIAPHGLLQAILRRSLDSGCSNVALTQRGHEDGLDVLLTAIGKLYLLGLQPKISALYPDIEFPVSSGTPFMSPNIDWEHSEDWASFNMMKTNLIAGEREVVLSMNQEEVRAYAGNCINGLVMFPEAGYLRLVWETFASLSQTQLDNMAVAFENVRFHESAYVPETGCLTLYLMVQRGTGEFEVLNKADKKVLATGKIYVPEMVEKQFVTTPIINEKRGIQLSSNDIYTEFEQRGYQYSGQFKSIVSAVVSETGSISETLWQNNWVTFIMSMIQQSVLQIGEDSQDVQLPASIQRLLISPARHSQDGLKTFEVLSHIPTSIILGGGIQIQGLKTKVLTKSLHSRHPELHLDTLKFVSHTNPRLQSVKDFVNVCVQIAVENSVKQIKSKSNVTIIEEGNPHSLVPQIEDCLSKYPHIEINIKTSCSNGYTSTSLEKKVGSFLVVTNSNFLGQGVMYLEKSAGFILTRVENTNSWKCSNDLIIVTEQDFGSGKFLLLRKVAHLDKSAPLVIQITEADKTWINQLRTSIKNKRRDILLVCKEEMSMGIASFKENISREPGSEVIRYFFLLDKSCPKFSLADNWFCDQLSQKLVVNIYQDKAWGSLRQLSLSEDGNVPLKNVALSLPTLDLQGIEMNYLGLNKIDEEESDQKCKLGHVDFSGRTGMSEWVMGVAKFGQAKSDPHLTWKVPEAWGMDEAATIPLAYATAYYALILTAKLESVHSVLIHEGCSSIGQAAIAIASDLGCRVFTTVANQEQQSYILSRFPKLPVSNIYSSKNSNFEIEIRLATKSKGVEVILNSLSGKRLQASFRCLSRFGNFLQLGRKDLIKNSTIGLLIFNRSTAFYGIATDNLFNACHEWKERLHTLVNDGIARGVVLPLDHRVFLYQQYHRAINMLGDDTQWNKVLLNVRGANKSSNCLQAEIIPKFQCDPSSSYLIVGGKTEQWLDLSSWLLQRGARKLVIAQQIAPISNYMTRRVDLLRKYHSATVFIELADKASTLAGANILVNQANKLGPLSGIFIMPLEKMAQENHEQNSLCFEGSASLIATRHLDMASRASHVQYFVCLLCDGADNVCLARRQVAQAGLAIQWDTRQADSVQLRLVLRTLDRLLGAETEQAVIFSQVCQQKKVVISSKLKDMTGRLDSFLPSSIEDLLKLGSELVSNVSMEEVASLSPGLREVKGVPPVFFLPGLQGASNYVLHPVASRIMYPAICVKLPRGGQSIQEMALGIARSVREVQHFGPYNLVGDTWAGALVLELASTLEAQGHKTQVFILEGAPETSIETIKKLGDGPHMDTNLILRLLKITSNKLIEELKGLHTWKSKLKHILSSLSSYPMTDINLLETAIETIHSHILALLAYQPEGPQLSGLVSLLRPLSEKEHNCGLIKFSKNTVSVHLVGKDHQELLSSIQTTDIICDSVIL